MFKSIKAKNFFSWESLEFDFKSGVTLIAGQNLDDNTSEGCHALGTYILMYDGSIKKVEEININDELMGPDSTSRKVLKLIRGTGLMYEINPSKGESFIVNEDHILTLKMSSKNVKLNYKRHEIINISVKEYINKPDRFKQDGMLFRSKIEFYKKQLLIPPYILGLWLGDGHSRGASLTTMDEEIKNEWCHYGKQLNLHCNIWSKEGNKASIYNLTSGRFGLSFGRNILFNHLRSLDLINNKHIPHEYLTSSREDRLQLLAGLLDTDGSLSGNGFDFIQKNKFISEQVCYLARSLGLAAYMKECRKSCQTGVTGTYYRVSISGDCSIIPNKLKRKQASKRKQVKDVLHTGFKLKKLYIDDFYGFKVNKDHLYLMRDFTVVHNCGKSSIPNALCWALYGQLPKDVNIDDVIKTGEKSCIVEVELENDTRIVRSRKPNQLYIECCGSIQTGKDLKETQKMVEAEIGMGFDTFLQSVYFAQNYSNKFITANQEQKAKILSELQDLSIFDRATKQTNDMLRKAVADLGILDIKLVEKVLTLNSCKDNIINLEQFSKNFQVDLDKKIADLKIKLARIDKEVLDAQSKIQPLINMTDIQNDMNQLIQQRNVIDRQLYHIEQLKIQRAQSELNQSCPTCNRPLDKDDSCIDIPDDSVLLASKEILALKINEMVDRSRELNSKNNESEHVKHNLERLQIESYNLGVQLKSLEISVNPYLELITQNKSKIEPLDAIVKDLKELQNTTKKDIVYLEFLKAGYKEIKSYVFQGLLADLNNKTNTYLRELFEVPAYITFDNVSNEGDISKIQTTVILDGYERSLGLLSGGQLRRVQLAVDFALSDIVSERSQKPINVRILDEAFKDLSEQSMSKVIDILQKMNGKTILIEHNSLIKNIVDRVYSVELKDGNSYTIP